MIDYTLGTALMLTGVVFCFALVFDLRYQRIPNKLCLVALLSGLIVQACLNQWQGLISAFAGAVVALMLLLPTFYFRILGGGDVKLMVAVGAIIGPQLLLWSLAYGVILGALTSILLATYKVGWKGLKATVIRYYHCLLLRQYFKPDKNEAAGLRVPYAPALALGWLWACYVNHDITKLVASVSFQLHSWLYL
jgi:prepilin peptidase CpaA